MSVVARKLILGLAGNNLVSGAMTRHGLQAGAGRFVAGESLESALAATAELNRQGLAVTLDLLGESVSDVTTAKAMAVACAAVIEGIQAGGFDANLSVKLTQLGLQLGPDVAFENMTLLQDLAARYDNFVRIDMESSSFTDATLAITKGLLNRQPNVGTVIQSYLRRSPADLACLAQVGANVRIVKGAYLEPPELVVPTKIDTDNAFRELVAQYLSAGCYTAVATHDEAMIEATIAFVNKHRIPRTQFEFQMLYGVRSARQLELVRAGYRTRVYVPFGQDWYPYFVRRMAERPANLWFVAKNLFRS
jgi:proline dehydrogenase